MPAIVKVDGNEIARGLKYSDARANAQLLREIFGNGNDSTIEIIAQNLVTPAAHEYTPSFHFSSVPADSREPEYTAEELESFRRKAHAKAALKNREKRQTRRDASEKEILANPSATFATKYVVVKNKKVVWCGYLVNLVAWAQENRTTAFGGRIVTVAEWNMAIRYVKSLRAAK